MNGHTTEERTLLVKDIGYLCTMDADETELEGAAIYVRGPEIQWVGRTADLPAEYQEADEVLSLTDHVVIPGLVNTHHHSFQNLTRCIAQERSLVDWLRTHYSAWEQIKGDDLYIGALIAMAELILSGCTTTSDHVYLFPNGAKLDDTIRAASEIGMRFHPTRGGSSVTKKNGGYSADSLVEEEGAMLQDMQRVISTFHDNSRYSMLRIGLAPTSTLKCSLDFFRQTAALARRNPGVRLHTHLAEIKSEVEEIRSRFGCSHSELLQRVDWDSNDCWFAHCCQLSDSDLAAFSAKGMGVAHCPSSNMRLASGIARVKEMLDAGVNVGLGVDGSSSNDTGHMLHETRLAMFLQRSKGDPTVMNSRDALKLCIKGGATNLGRDDIGKIAPGFAADFVAWDTNVMAFSGAMMDPIAALVLCTPGLGPVDYAIINGRVVVRQAKLTTIDLKAAVKKHRAASSRLCQYLPEEWRAGL